MRSLGRIAFALLALGGAVRADQGWEDSQDGNNFACYDVGYFAANNLTAGGNTNAEPTTGKIILGQQSTASWPVGTMRWYCLDGDSGSDANVGFSNTSSADCGNNAVRTESQLNTILPFSGLDRDVVVLVKSMNSGGSYSAPASFLSGRYGYRTFVTRATVTNSTAGSVAFADDANDQKMAGGVTATGMNAAGYNPTGSPTQRAIQLVKAGGGSPGFGAEPAIPDGARIRFDNATSTAALRGYRTTIVKTSGGDTIEVAVLLPAVPGGSDIAYIEMPGANFTDTNVLIDPVSTTSGLMAPMVGFNITGKLSVEGVVIPAFTWSSGSMRFIHDTGGGPNSVYSITSGTLIDTGGAVRIGGNLQVGSNTATVTAIGIAPFVAGGVAIDRTGSIELVQGFVTNAGISFNRASLATSQDGDPDGIGTIPHSIGLGMRNCRIAGTGLISGGVGAFGLFDGSMALSIGGLEIAPMGAAPAIMLGVTGGSLVINGPLSGSSGNADVGLDLTLSTGSTIALRSVPTVTGTAGDVRLCDGTIVTWTQANAGIIDACNNQFVGTVRFPFTIQPSGTVMSGGAVTITNMSGGGAQCVQVNNAGVLSGVGSACGAGAGVTSVTGTAQRISTAPTTGAVVVDTIGGFYSGAVSGGNENLGSNASGVEQQVTTAGVAVLSTYQCVANELQYGAASGGGLAQSTKLVIDPATFSPDVQLGVSGRIRAGLGSTGGDFLAVAGSTFSGGFQMWKDVTPTKAMNIGLGVPGGTASADLVISAYRPGWTEVARVTNLGSVVIGTSALATSAQDGYLYISSMAGVPTNNVTPQNSGASIPLVYDTTHGRLYIPSNAPKPIAQDTTGFATGLMKNTTTTGVWSIGVAGTDYQAPLTACTDYVSLSCVTGATDLGGTNATPTVIGIENEAAMRGDILATSSAAPATPSAGHGRIWFDSTAKTLTAVNDAGGKTHTVQSRSIFPNFFVNSLSDNGVLGLAQPDFSDLTGSATCAQLPALTGGVTTSAGSCATTLNITPTSCGANTFGTSINGSGAISCTQPAFTNISGTLACGQTPAFTGDTTKASGSCATVTSALTDTAGAGSSHATTGSWGANQLLQTDAGGAIKAAGVACSMLPAFTGSATSAGGSCATKVVALDESGGAHLPLGSIPDSNPNATAIIRVAGSTSVIGVATTALYVRERHDFFISIPSLQAVNTAPQQAATASPTPYSAGAVTNPIEYPNTDFIATNIMLELDLVASIGVASTMDIWATRNGTLITGTKFTITPGTTGLGTIILGPVSTGSASNGDTYGIQMQYNGDPIVGPFGAQVAFTLRMSLST